MSGSEHSAGERLGAHGARPSAPDAHTGEAANRSYHEAQDRMALLPNYYAWIARRFRDHVRGTVLELGCGAGHVVRHYVDRVERVVGVDFNERLVSALEANHPGGKVRGVVADLRGDWSELGDLTADAVVALDVLEHFEDDGAFVEKVARRLRPGGKAILKVPAQSALYGAMDRASGHHRRYDRGPLCALLEAHGFRPLRVRAMNPAGAWGYRFKRDQPTNYSRSLSPTKLRAINAFMPLLAALDHVPGLGGLSWIGVFERAGRG